MPSIGARLRDAVVVLKAAGAENPRLDAVLLLGEALGLDADRVRLDQEKDFPESADAVFMELLERRRGREPMSQILGRREFWSREFRVTSAVLDPRPDSETLIELVLGEILNKAAPLGIIDLGTGSGCLLLTLLAELPQASGLGIDYSAEALDVARGNAESLGLSARAAFHQGDWGEGIERQFDILISNPPYIESAAVAGLQPEVARFEPLLALDGGTDGLAAYRRLIPHLARLAKADALVALEVGQGQAEAVARLLKASGFGETGSRQDLGGIERVVWARKPGH